jgi:hypothetical protein
MLEPTARQCGHCCHARQITGALHCARNPPTPDPATGAARWPQVHPTDFCGRFRPTIPANVIASEAKQSPSCRAGGHNPNHNSSIVNHKCQPALPVFADSFGPYCRIPLTQGRFAKVDPADYLWLSQFRWCVKIGRDTCYAVRTIQVRGRSRRIYMHRQIMNTPPHLVCDHVNHDGLDNRRNNCRNCTTAQNNANRRKRGTSHGSRATTSRYLGVSWDKRRGKWTAHIKKHGRSRYLGAFEMEEDAARAYAAAAAALHGPFAAVSNGGKSGRKEVEPGLLRR